jgi:hypothetical protein
MRKLFAMFIMFTMAVLVSCSSDSVTPRKETVAPPPTPQTIYVLARTYRCIAVGEQADVYYAINASGWLFLASVTTTSCTSLPSLSAYTGDVVQFKVLQSSSGLDVAYSAGIGYSCAPPIGGYCDGYYFQHTVTTNNASVGLEISSYLNGDQCGYLGTCM